MGNDVACVRQQARASQHSTAVKTLCDSALDHCHIAVSAALQMQPRECGLMSAAL